MTHNFFYVDVTCMPLANLHNSPIQCLVLGQDLHGKGILKIGYVWYPASFCKLPSPYPGKVTLGVCFS
jgi:hypothetical protein